MPRFSVIIPVYNRPDELRELLGCLAAQTLPPFEVVVVEDGSTMRAEAVVKDFIEKLNVRYFEKPNGGQGFARNYGMERATGEWFIILDSDALIEADYLEIVSRELSRQGFDLYGGPDRDHPSFTPVQKAISYAMTSLYTTGGIRNRAANAGGVFYPRSFNMGLSRRVYEATGGFRITRMGEDLIFSTEAIGKGFRAVLLPEAFIYHKRRTDFAAFFRQLKFFGRSRINIARFFPETLKAVHFFPAAFVLWLLSFPLQAVLSWKLLLVSGLLLGVYGLLIASDIYKRYHDFRIVKLGLMAVLVQLTGYGLGFLQEGLRYLREPKGTRLTGEQTQYPS